MDETGELIWNERKQERFSSRYQQVRQRNDIVSVNHLLSDVTLDYGRPQHEGLLPFP